MRTCADCDRSLHQGVDASKAAFCFWYKLQDEKELLGLSTTSGVEPSKTNPSMKTKNYKGTHALKRQTNIKTLDNFKSPTFGDRRDQSHRRSHLTLPWTHTFPSSVSCNGNITRPTFCGIRSGRGTQILGILRRRHRFFRSPTIFTLKFEQITEKLHEESKNQTSWNKRK